MPYYIDKETGKQVEGWCWHVAQKQLPAWVNELIDGGTIKRKRAWLEYDGEMYFTGCFLTRDPLSICSLQSFKAHYQSLLNCKVKRTRAKNKMGHFTGQYDYA